MFLVIFNKQMNKIVFYDPLISVLFYYGTWYLPSDI